MMPPQNPAPRKRPQVRLKLKPVIDPPGPSDREDDDRIMIGGLMRCCTETIGDLYPNGRAKVAIEGQALQCKYAPDSPNHRMIFRAGYWLWDAPGEKREDE